MAENSLRDPEEHWDTGAHPEQEGRANSAKVFSFSSFIAISFLAKLKRKTFRGSDIIVKKNSNNSEQDEEEDKININRASLKRSSESFTDEGKMLVNTCGLCCLSVYSLILQFMSMIQLL